MTPPDEKAAFMELGAPLVRNLPPEEQERLLASLAEHLEGSEDDIP